MTLSFSGLSEGSAEPSGFGLPSGIGFQTLYYLPQLFF